MSFFGLSVHSRMVAAVILLFVLSGCGASHTSHLSGKSHDRSHNKLATKILADIAIARVRGAMPTKVARRRGPETL